MENSDATISCTFFDNFWPLILDQNKCDIQSSNTAEYFIPQQKFDHLWAHEFLASKNYNNYAIPIDWKYEQTTEQQTATAMAEDEIEQLPYRESSSKILPLDQQLAILQQDVEIRQKLANDFASRQFPWHIQRSSYDYDFNLTEELKQLFKDSFQYELLKNIQRWRCSLMIIDVGPAVPLKNLECWLKFSAHAAIITVIHDMKLYGKVKTFNRVFQPVLMKEQQEATWQEELNRSIEVGLQKAKELFIYEDAGNSFAFVFSHCRGICVCDKFKILKKF